MKRSFIRASLFLLVVLLGLAAWFMWGAPIQATPAGYTRIKDAKEGVSFNAPSDWMQSSSPEAGDPDVTSPDFSSEQDNPKGAYISYHRYLPPSDTGTSDEYFQSLMESYIGPGYGAASKITLDGRIAYKITSPGTVVVIGKDGDYAVVIFYRHYSTQTDQYQSVFSNFLESFKFL
jgi:hypothetical protein